MECRKITFVFFVANLAWISSVALSNSTEVRNSELFLFGDDADDFDFDGADLGDAEVLAVDLGYFLRKVSVDGVEFGVGPNLEPEVSFEFAAAAGDAGAGGDDATELLAAGFEQAVQGVARDFEAASFVGGEQQALGFAQEKQRGKQADADPHAGQERGGVDDVFKNS